MEPAELVTISADSLHVESALDAGHFWQILPGTYCAPEQVAKQVALRQLLRESDEENSEQQRLVCPSTDKILSFCSSI